MKDYTISTSRIITITVIFIVTVLFTRLYLHTEDEVPVRDKLTNFPLSIGKWEGSEIGLGPDIVEAAGVDDYIMRNYAFRDRDDPYWINLYVGYYQSQRKGKTYHSPQNCLPGSGWQVMTFERVPILVDDNMRVVVNRALIQKGLEKQLVIYWYQDRGRIIANEYLAKFYLIYDAIKRRRTDGALVRILTPVRDSDVEEAFEHEKVFIRLIFPYLKRFLPE